MDTIDENSLEGQESQYALKEAKEVKGNTKVVEQEKKQEKKEEKRVEKTVEKKEEKKEEQKEIDNKIFSMYDVLSDEENSQIEEEEEEEERNNVEEEEEEEDTNKPPIGVIDTSFPENENAVFEGISDFPLSYCTLRGKERLLLLFAENFRRQFRVMYPKRNPCVLAVPNECGVQKFVCTTIRPTAFLFPEFIGCWEECAKFVADFITYQPLKNPTELPNRLISPDTLLHRRKGNCFEMATLLASMLTGTGFAAMVVSGYATREVCNNDQRRVVCPYIPVDKMESDVQVEKTTKKYQLRDPADLRSKFLIEVDKREKDKVQKKIKKLEEQENQRRKALEQLPEDPLYGQRVHCWIAIIENAPWCHRPDCKDPDNKTPEAKAFFIEPSTGLRFESDNPNYLGAESAWNQHNYYLNRQDPISDLINTKWDLQNTELWEHLLIGEPAEMRIECPIPDDMEALARSEDLSKEKHLDVPPSWVRQLHIGLPDFEERYPNGEKVIHYMRSIYERFSPYKNRNGLIKRLTMTDDLEYKELLVRYEWYENRHDMLQKIKVDFRTCQIEEFFAKGREDALQHLIRNADKTKEWIFNFYHLPRSDCLKCLEVAPLYIREYYENRPDKLDYREFKMKEGSTRIADSQALIHMFERFNRNSNKKASKDMAIRRFNITNNTIYIQFHYDDNAITANNRLFTKPPKPNYGCEVIFMPECSVGYNANPLEPEPTQVEQYLLLLQQLEAEEKCIESCKQRCNDIQQIIKLRKTQINNPQLVFSIFDALRNSTARDIRMEQYEQMQKHIEKTLQAEADFLAPYLVKYMDNPPDHEESKRIFNACLNDYKTEFLTMLNELQRRYDEHVSEAQHFKKFLKRFQHQFDDFEYEELIKEGEKIEINKRMIQQRLINGKANSQAKYEKIKKSLYNDPRLNLKN